MTVLSMLPSGLYHFCQWPRSWGRVWRARKHPLASILFCVQHVTKPEDWCPILVTAAFWCSHGEIALMMVLSMLPTGLCHFCHNIRYLFCPF